MKLDLKKINDCERLLKVNLSWKDIKNDYHKEFNKVKSRYQMPGFRKGKVPEHIIKKNLTASIDAQFVDNSINIYYREALKELKIVPINQGQIKNIDFKAN